MVKKIADGVVHTLPADLQKSLVSPALAKKAWEDITPLARNEWICWTISVKKAETRKDHVRRAVEDLARGKEYVGAPAMQLFQEHFPSNYDFDAIAQRIFTNGKKEVL